MPDNNENNNDLEFLLEIREKFKTGIDKRDPGLIEYGFRMIDDWIEELEDAKG